MLTVEGLTGKKLFIVDYCKYRRSLMNWYTLYTRPYNLGMGFRRFGFVFAKSIIDAAKQFDENTNFTDHFNKPQLRNGSLAKPFICNGGASELVVLEGKQGHL
jgi:hypothetical protein